VKKWTEALKNCRYVPMLLMLQTVTADRFVSFSHKLKEVLSVGNLYAPIAECDGIIRSRPCGFFSNFMGVIGLLDRCEKSGRTPTVLFDSGAYYDPGHGPNWWEYFFEPIAPADFRVVSPFPSLHEQSDADAIRLSYFARDLLSLSRKHELVKKHIKIKPHILEKVDQFAVKEFNGHYVVGMHLRGTDKVRKEGAVRLPDDYIKKQIDAILKKRPKYKIFLATEDSDSLSRMQALFKDRLVFWDSTRLSGNPVHASKGCYGYKIGEDVLIDCLLLSRCDYLLASISNVSQCALVFNPRIEHSHFMRFYRNDLFAFRRYNLSRPS